MQSGIPYLREEAKNTEILLLRPSERRKKDKFGYQGLIDCEIDMISYSASSRISLSGANLPYYP